MNSTKSLSNLYGDKPLDRPEYDSHLARECHRLWNEPINKLSVENLRMLIGQNIGLEYLVPKALDILESNPFSQGHMYKGDLILSVARVESSFWSNNTDLNNRLVELRIDLNEILETLTEEIMPLLKEYEYK